MDTGLIAILILVLGLVLGFLFPSYRLKLVLARPFPLAYSRILRTEFVWYLKMPTHVQMQLKRLIKQFLYQKNFVGCAGLVLSTEMKVSIAARACMLLLNRKTDVYAKLDTILVYPSAFLVPRKEIDASGVVSEGRASLLGESWSNGRVVLAWDHVHDPVSLMGEGHDVVLHEFAHQLDSETGTTNGAPWLPSAKRYRQWSAVLSRSFQNLELARDSGSESLMDFYGATNPAEFFAVATETFFLKPHALALDDAPLFEQLSAYYRVDPREWI